MRFIRDIKSIAAEVGNMVKTEAYNIVLITYM